MIALEEVDRKYGSISNRFVPAMVEPNVPRKIKTLVKYDVEIPGILNFGGIERV